MKLGLICSALVVTAISGLAFSAELPEHPACGPRTLKNYALLGPVKSVRVEGVDAAGRHKLAEKYVFDRTGRLLEDKHAIAADDPEQLRYEVFRYRYEPKGKNYEINLFEINPAQGEKPIDLQRHLVKFNSQGLCAEERDIDSDGEPNGTNTYEYDSHGDFVKEIDRNGDNSIFSV